MSRIGWVTSILATKMLRSTWRLTCLGVCGAGFALLTTGGTPRVSQAEERELDTPRSSIDAVLVIDASGSMLVTDPLRLRYEGAKLLLQFLGKGDRLGVVAFSDTATVVSGLQPFSSEPSDPLISSIQNVKTDGRYTDLLEAIKVGSNLLESNPREDAQRVLILLSDGKMEPEASRGTAMGRTQELVNDVLPELKAKEIKIHTLAFSSQADRELLGEISNATDGLNWYTKEAADLQKSFADLFLAVKRPQVVQLTSKGFRIDDDVEEATFYVNHEEGATLTLVTPKNNEISAAEAPEWVTWFSGKTFDVITLREPEAGDWQIQGVTTSDGFAAVLTNLKLVTDWPSIVRAEDKVLVQARLYESEKPVALPEMSDVIKYAFQIAPTDKISEPLIRDLLNDEGLNGDRVARDGIFSSVVTLNEPGEYRLTLVARAPTFQRSQQMPFRVRPRLVTLKIVDPDEVEAHHEPGSDHGKEESKQESPAEGDDKKKITVHKGSGQSVFKVELSAEVSSFRMVDVKLMAKAGDRKRYELPLRRSPSNPLEYEFLAGALPEDGRYLLQAFLKAETKKRQEVEAESKKIIFERSLLKSEPEVPVSVVIRDKEEEAPKTQGFPFIPMAIVTGINAVLAFAGLTLVKRMAPKQISSVSRYVPPRELKETLAALQEAAARVEVDFNDPFFDTIQEDEQVDGQPSPRAEEAAVAEGA
jgi:Mg-chelatase subunit ChlD